jgi:uncharacterized membrane protein
MATLTVLKFETPDGAEKALTLMQSLQKQNLIQVQDAATVSWPQGAKKPKTKQAVNLGAAAALNGAFWGMLFGLIFLVPIFGLAVGALMGGLSGKAADFGIDDNFIKQTREKVTEGTSAVFLLTSNAVVDRVTEEMKTGLPKFELIASNLSKEQEEQLKTVFGEE